ncbi:5-carboxymethyl-2-hydroxymuconate Delta-isomerase [Shewanella sedimentimangrovi]|uniref:5-carboxymethyl-2-hydroxymuconate Delta-isomerase n=1 Tax=Shewanella sedimentimangrovi TaxID=2814293 RepID=A0ABX7R0E8_9GAMM|nr:5-carboxymethyl-2-hydroxymuconate Delta-isomerase [Shewanella sedimentimangrovi]QSX36568.1 5-carboxymethyl-2-hydroxymuconate Delta-isomerase [Shewanella sedimentimangrovi]
MPHFVVDCAHEVLSFQDEEYINEQLFLVASASGLFDDNDIKVRVNPFKTYSVGNQRQHFIHVFANVMEGRTTEQKANLSKAIVTRLTELFPQVPYIAVNIRDFERATYCNRDML